MIIFSFFIFILLSDNFLLSLLFKVVGPFGIHAVDRMFISYHNWILVFSVKPFAFCNKF